MAKRQRREFNMDCSDDVVSETSAEFGGFELVKDFCYAHPILKSIEVAKGKNCYDLFSSFSGQVPRRQRSKQIIRREKKTAARDGGLLRGSLEGSIVEEGRSQCHFTVHPRKPRNWRGKQKAETSDCEIIHECSLSYGRQSRRLHRSTTDGQKWGKLDSEKFEIYMENVWRSFAEEKKKAFTYLDSLWFSLYTKESLKGKVLSWIKKKDIFSKKYVFVPIVQWSHWFLLIFCNFGEDPQSNTKSRCILLLDSLREANSKQLEPGIRRFVFDIFKTEERPEKKELIRKIPLLIPKVPQQKNGEECGFFVLYYISQFLESASDNFSFSMGYPHFMKEDWFTPEQVECFVEGLDSMNKNSDCSL